MKLRWFEKRGMLLTLVYLYDTGTANQKTIGEAVGVTNDTLRHSVFPTLEKMGFIRKDTKQDFPWETKVELTEKGKRVAAFLSEAGIISYR